MYYGWRKHREKKKHTSNISETGMLLWVEDCSPKIPGTLGLCRRDGVRDEVLLDGGGPKPRDRVLIRHGRGETGAQRRSHVETEAETGGRLPPAQGWTPGAPRSRKRWGGPSPGDSGRSSALGPLDVRCQISISLQTKSSRPV